MHYINTCVICHIYIYINVVYECFKAISGADECDMLFIKQCVKSLGPLELILATPSHHRVHHGRNRYCIDKNYGGTLIIWDKIFG